MINVEKANKSFETLAFSLFLGRLAVSLLAGHRDPQVARWPIPGVTVVGCSLWEDANLRMLTDNLR